MPYYHFRTIVGDLHFDKNFNVVRKPRQQKAKILSLSKDKLPQALHTLHDSRYYSEFVAENIKQSTKDISTSLTTDVFLIQASAAVDDIQRSLNILTTRIREWLGYALPELVHAVDTSVLIKQLSSSSLGALLKKYKITPQMSANQPKTSEKALLELINIVQELQQLLSYEQQKVDELAQKIMPNVVAVSGAALGSKLLRLAGSLERLSKMPASTIQVLGAETALFRHLRSKAKPPKHGVLHEHPLVVRVKANERGKAARDIAGKICIASKVDYFKGKYVGDKLVKELQKRFVAWK